MDMVKIKEALKELVNERRSLLNAMESYDSATSDQNRELAVKLILNNLKAIDEIGDRFRAAVFTRDGGGRYTKEQLVVISRIKAEELELGVINGQEVTA